MSITSSAEPQWRIGGDGAQRACKPDLLTVPSRREHVAVPQARPMNRLPPGRWDGGGLRRSDYSRRDTRQKAKRRGSAPIGGGRESPLTHLVPRCRHDSSRTRGSSQPPPAAAAPARTRRFAAASNRSERPAHRRCIDRHRRAWEKLHRSRKRSNLIEVSVHQFAQAAGSSGELERRSALTMKR